MSTYNFDDQCLQIEEYKKCTICGDNNTSAKCKVGPIPRKNIELFNMGEGDVKSHGVDEKPCERLAFYKKTC